MSVFKNAVGPALINKKKIYCVHGQKYEILETMTQTPPIPFLIGFNQSQRPLSLIHHHAPFLEVNKPCLRVVNAAMLTWLS